MLIPALRYDDTEAALRFVSDVLQLEEHVVHRSEDGTIQNAQFKVGTGLMMFAPPQGGTFDEHMVAPKDVGNRATMSIYVVVQDIAARYDHIKATGANILQPLEAQSYGGSNFTIADTEGHVWSFNDYDPMAS